MNKVYYTAFEPSEIAISEESEPVLEQIADLEEFEGQEAEVTIVPSDEPIPSE